MTADLSYDGNAQTLDVLAVRGMDKPEIIHWWGKRHEMLDGSLTSHITAFNKVIEVDFGVIQDETTQKFICYWLASDGALFGYNGFTSYVCPEAEQYEDEWLDQCQYGSRFVVRLLDKTPYAQFTGNYVETAQMILIRKVEITGTQASPQTLTTGSSPLTVDVWGNALPTFDDTTQAPGVFLDSYPYQEAHIDGAGFTPVISGGNIVFKAAVSNAGNPASDGKYYTDIKIIIQDAP